MSRTSFWIRVAAVIFIWAWIIGLLAMSGCAHLPKIPSDPMAPWSAVRSQAEIEVINSYDRPCEVDARIKSGEIRVLGTVEPGDTVIFKLPFADQDVMIVACATETVLKIDRPRRWTLEITEISQPIPSGAPRRPTTPRET